MAADKTVANLRFARKSVRHILVEDESEDVAMIAMRFAAFLLEPKSIATRRVDIAKGLELLAEWKAAAGLAAAHKWRLWASRVRSGLLPRARFVTSVAMLLDALSNLTLTGRPDVDWLHVRNLLSESAASELVAMSREIDAIYSRFGCLGIYDCFKGIQGSRGVPAKYAESRRIA